MTPDAIEVESERMLPLPSLVFVIGVHLLGQAIMVLAWGPPPLFVAGLTQVFYVVPIVITLLVLRYRRNVLHLLISVGILFMMNAFGCGAMFAWWAIAARGL